MRQLRWFGFVVSSTLAVGCGSPTTRVESKESAVVATSTAEQAAPPACWSGSIAFGECGAVTAGNVSFTVGGVAGSTNLGSNWADPAQLIITNRTNDPQVLVVFCWPDSICNHLNYEPGDPLGNGWKACEQAIPRNGTLSIVIQDIYPGCMYAMISGAPAADAGPCYGY